MAKSRSIGSIYASLTLRDTGFRKGLDGAGKKLKEFSVKSAAIGGAAVGAGLAAGLAKAMSEAANLQSQQAAFVPLLGSADAAQKRIDELSKFARDTPFDLPEIAKASKILETLTQGTLATGRGLTLVGDIAASANRPFDEIATSVGRLYDGLMSGRSVGEPLSRLQELGALSGDVRAQIEAMQKQGQKGMPVWAVAEQSLKRFSGSMDILSKTWTGRVNGMKDTANYAFAQIGMPILATLAPLLEKMAKEDFPKMGVNLGNSIGFGLTALTDGKVWKIFELQGMKALASIQASPLNNNFAASINAAWDTLMTGKTSTYAESLEKYSIAGIEANSEIIDGIQARIDGINEGIRETLAKNLADFANLGTTEPKPPPFDAAAALSTAAATAAPKPWQFQRAPLEVNDYQRRGWSLSETPTTLKADKQLQVMERIHESLKRIAATREPLTF